MKQRPTSRIASDKPRTRPSTLPRFLAAVLALASLLVIAAPASAHTEDEQLRWLLRWSRNVDAEHPNVEAVAARQDFMNRHNIMSVDYPDSRCLLTDCEWSATITYWPAPEPEPEPEPVASEPVEAAPAAPSVNTGMGSGVEQWRGLVAAYFPADQVDTALRVMACESGGNPNAYNPSGASGLMQVLSSWADNFGVSPDDLFNPETNIWIASELYYDGGWGHWVCY